MHKIGNMWILDDDPFIGKYFDPQGVKGSPEGDQFEIDHLDLALSFVKQFRVAIDGGAHYGSWTRYMAKRFDRVLSFEPTTPLYECARRNTEHLENVEMLRVALGDHVGRVTVGKGKYYLHPGTETVTDYSQGDTPMLTVDSLNLSTLDFLKLDIEGYERYALTGAMHTLERCHPVVLFEENIRGEVEHGVKTGSCGKFLATLGASLVGRIGSDHIYAWE